MEHQSISYCGFYCEACPLYIKKKCVGCKGDNPLCAKGYKACKVRPCNIKNGYQSCAECTKYTSVRECKDFNPLMIRFGQFITRTNRRKGIEMIKEKGLDGFLLFMNEKGWVTVKLKK